MVLEPLPLKPDFGGEFVELLQVGGGEVSSPSPLAPALRKLINENSHGLAFDCSSTAGQSLPQLLEVGHQGVLPKASPQ